MAESESGKPTLCEESFIDLLRNLVGEARHLQNNFPEYIPKEDRAGRHVLSILEPYSKDQGGPLVITHRAYMEGRGNLIVEYPGTDSSKIMSFVGCHMDVVTANPDDWEFDPFSLSIDGDKLRGRGTTDCLGHVALVTLLMKELAVRRIPLKTTVVAVFIANEEGHEQGIGVDALVKEGLLDKLRDGPLFWVDTADTQPCIGTGGMCVWKLRAYGKMFHSGLPHKAINPLELGMEALAEIQRRFYADFPPHPEEKRYGFATSATMKPTQWSCPPGSVNQIPGECTISGDIRMTPFYDMNVVVQKLKQYAEEIQAKIDDLPTRGPWSKYSLPDEGLRGRIEVSVDGIIIQGVACSLESPGFHALCKATEDVFGFVKPYSITGTLPLIRDLQDAGFDVQTMGYGVMSTYHAKNEYCCLSDFKKGFDVLFNIINQLNA